MAIDVDALGDGLVVVPGVSTGVAADLRPPTWQRPTGVHGRALQTWRSPIAPDQPVRLRDRAGLDDRPRHGRGRARRSARKATTVLAPGLGRPLILTPLEPEVAMRVLGSERRGTFLVAGALIVAAALIVVGLVLVVLGW